MDGLYASESLLQVSLVTGVLGGGAAFLAGRAIAQTWRPFWHVLVYMAMLGAAVRFVHFALFEATLLRPPPTPPTRSISSSLGALAWRMTRAAQMATQYYWLYERTGPLTWRERTPRRGNSGSERRQSPGDIRQKPDKMTPGRVIAAGATMRSAVR